MRLKLFLLVFAALLLIVAGCAEEEAVDLPVDENEEDEATDEPVADDGEIYEFSLAHFFPATHAAETELVQGWAAALAEASDGRIVITSYYGGNLLGGSEIYDGVVSGVADIGLSAFFYTRGRFPVLEAFELPGIVYENSYAASMVAWEGIKELNPAEVQDTELMYVLATGPGDLFTKEPVRELSDLQGMRIRAGGLSIETLELLGADAMAMDQSEVYEALLRNMVDGNMAPVEVLQGWSQAEVTDYLTITPFLYNALFFITMNQEKWDELPADLQQIFLEVNEQFHQEVAAGLWDKLNEEALEWAVAETGQEVITLSDEEQQKWIDIIQPVQGDFIGRMNEQGLPGEEIMETVKRLAGQY